MSSDEPVNENLEVFQGQVSKIGKLMLVGVLEKLFEQPVEHHMVSNFIEPFMAAGSNSVNATASLAALMLDGVEIQKEIPLIKLILTHHVFEVVFDTLDKGIKATPEERDRLITLNEIACKIIQDPDYEYSKDNNFISIKKYLDSNVPDYILTEDFKIPVSSALKRSFATLAELSKYANEFANQEFSQSLKDSLLHRYNAVSFISAGAYNNLENYEDALYLRQKAILIETTMKAFIMHLAQQDQGVMKYLSDNCGVIVEMIEDSAKLIGIWNDFGSSFTHDASKIDTFFNIIKEQVVAQAPENIRRKLKNLVPGEPVSDVNILLERIENEVIREKMRSYLQLLKDAVNDEPNIALDFQQGISIEDRKAFFIDLHAKVDLLIGKLTLFYCNFSVPQEIRNIIYNSMLFHYHVYNGTDYYNSDTTGLEGVITKILGSK